MDKNSTLKTSDKEEIDDLELSRFSGGKDVFSQETVEVPKTKIELIKKIVRNLHESAGQLSDLLSGTASEEAVRVQIGQLSENISSASEQVGGQVIEGVFDGESMIGPDGKQYSIPANYASKSKLVEGDILKLTITDSGTFVYKQIGPIERRRIVGVLEKAGGGNFTVGYAGKSWRVITASVTYYKGEAGDEVVILVPKSGESRWAAVENIVKKAK